MNDVAAGALGFAARLEPANLPTPEDLGPVFDSVSAKQLDDDSLWPSYEAALRIENPELHSPASVDCVSCHAAQPARFWMERNTALGNRFSASRYTSTQPLEVVSAIDDTTRVLRAFGWFQARPAISARGQRERCGGRLPESASTPVSSGQAGASASMTARTDRASACAVNGLARNCVPGSSTLL